MTVVPIGVKFSLVRTTLTIGPGQSGIVYDFSIPKGWVGFIERVGNENFEDCYYIWTVDGKQIGGKIDYVLGHINAPLEYDPPIIVKRQILWVGYNDGQNTEVFEVLTDGIIFPDIVTLTEAEKIAKAAVAKLTPQELEALRAQLTSPS